MVATTQPEAIAPYALRVVEQWKLGRRKVDDAVLLLVAKNDRAVRIAVDDGLERVLTDLTANGIIGDEIAPRFKQGDYFGGIDAGIAGIMRVVEGQALPAPAARSTQRRNDIGRLAPVLLVIVLAAGSALRAALGRLPGAAVTAAAVGAVAWLLSGTLIAAVAGALIAFFFTLLGAGVHGARYGRGGFMRVQSTTRGGTKLEIEKCATPPPELELHGRAEITRLSSVIDADPFVRLALWKASATYRRR